MTTTTARRAAAMLALGLSAAMLAACTGSTDDRPASSPSGSARPVSLTMLVFNVEYGGTHATDAVMADLDADVVGVLESYNRLPEIAKAAGYPYYDVGLQILSKYPILEPSAAKGLYAYIEVRPGEAVALINTHLDYVNDGPNRLARGVPMSDVLRTEKRVRLASMRTLLPSAVELLGEGWPVLLSGDFNEPSHLDWTQETAGQHDGVGPVAWPVSKALVGAGLHDTYRETHPDPVTDPGNTWGGVTDHRGSPRRIDFVYAGGPVQILGSEVVGERGAEDVDRSYPHWTSDHRAVLSHLEVSPAPIPTTVALSSRLVTGGDELTVHYRLPRGSADGTVRLDGPTPTSYDAPGSSGSFEVRTKQLAPGSYRVELLDGARTAVATNRLYVRPKNARVRLATDAPAYDVGEPITVRWADGPANRWDWIGVYRAGAADPEKDDYLVWGYTGGHDAGALPPTTDGALVLGKDHQGSPWPLPPGRYVVHYLLTDQYHSIGSARFAVRR